MSTPIKRIFLVRHGESLGNVDRKVYHTVADHSLELSEKGREQATEAGKFLNEYLKGLDDPDYIGGRGKVRPMMWTSPYVRARQTADGIVSELERVGSPVDYRDGNGPVPQHPRLIGRRENIVLCEQQHGLFDGWSKEELSEQYPAEHAHYTKCKDFGGRFWARMPLGESRFDVAVRVHQIFGTWRRDSDKHGRDNLIVVAHGTTNRAILMRWLHLGPEWFEEEPNPKNCSVRLIEDNEDKGYIHKGG